MNNSVRKSCFVVTLYFLVFFLSLLNTRSNWADDACPGGDALTWTLDAIAKAQRFLPHNVSGPGNAKFDGMLPFQHLHKGIALKNAIKCQGNTTNQNERELTSSGISLASNPWLSLGTRGFDGRMSGRGKSAMRLGLRNANPIHLAQMWKQAQFAATVCNTQPMLRTNLGGRRHQQTLAQYLGLFRQGPSHFEAA